MSKDLITAQILADHLGAKLFGDSYGSVADVTHDSRQAGEGTLFVAISVMLTALANAVCQSRILVAV